MAANHFEAGVREQQRGGGLALPGGGRGVVAAGADAPAPAPAAVLLNFHGVEYINSTGIPLIVSLLAQARKSHRRVLAYGLSDHYQEIFQITRLADFMSIFPDEESAFAGAPASAAADRQS